MRFHDLECSCFLPLLRLFIQQCPCNCQGLGKRSTSKMPVELPMRVIVSVTARRSRYERHL
jgi:hypothetical protein